MKKIVVVGEKFSEFANRNKNVLTVNEFERFVWSNEIQDVNKIVIGQGVELEHISRSFCIIRQHYPEKMKDIVNLDGLFYQNNEDHQKSVHKKLKNNILITSPEKKGNDIYLSSLILQDSSELLCDHQTGQHIQGMVLIEAARQAIISTSEKYLLKESEVYLSDKYFTLTSLSVNFSSFVFPLPVDVSLRVLSKKNSSYGRFTCECSVIFEQTGEEKAEVCFTFSVNDLGYITKRECEQASLCHENYLVAV